MATLYHAQYLIQPDFSLLEAGALLEERGKISAVGTFNELKKSAPAAKIVDYGDALLLPVFINAHTHLELSLFPTWASAAGVATDPCSFVDWILRLIKVKQGLKSEIMGEAIEAGIRMSLAAGTGAIGDILSWYEGRCVYQHTPLRGRIFLESLGQNPLVTRQLYENLSAILLEHGSGQLEYGLSPHSPYTIHSDYMGQLFTRCREDQLACSTHIAESTAELNFLNGGEGALVEQLYSAVNWQQYRPEARHMRPIEYLAAHGGLFKNQLLVHGVQLTAQEMTTIASAGAQLVLCPRSNAQLQVGTAPVAELKRAGVPLALGTDSLASNQSLSLWDELAFAAEVYADALNVEELFALATIGGARALGLQGELGALRAGLRCSFQLLRSPQGARPQNLLADLVQGGKDQQVEALVLDGVSVL